MWIKLADFILRFRLLLILALASMTGFMAYEAATGLKMSYHFTKLVPPDDEDMKVFTKFKETFGEDNNVLAIGIEDSSFLTLKNFKALSELCTSLKEMEGVQHVYGIPVADKLVVERTLDSTTGNTTSKFVSKKIFEPFPESQEELDSLIDDFQKLNIFKGQLYNPENHAAVILVSVVPDIFDSKLRLQFMNSLLEKTDKFQEDTGVDLLFAGVPYIRSIVTNQVASELKKLLLIVLLVMAAILFLFFRSFSAVFFPVLVIGVSVIWTLGTLSLLNYEITLLTGLIPSIIVVIGIPNCIYLINKFHHEFKKHQDKKKALSIVIRRIGIVTLITNLTTATGFLVLIFNEIGSLREFGIVAGINILATFLISIILIPAVFSYLPNPTTRHLKHLEFLPLKSFLNWLDFIVAYRRKYIYGFTVLLVIISAWGTWKIYTVSYMLDDIPKDSPIKEDLISFEKDFKGIMPLEIVLTPYQVVEDSVDGKLVKDTVPDKQAYLKLRNLKKIAQFEDSLVKSPYLSPSVSIVSFAKAFRQAFYNGDVSSYSLPTRRDYNFIGRTIRNSDSQYNELIQSLVDSTTGQIRLSMKVADIGSKKLDTLIREFILPMAEIAFKDSTSRPASIIDYNITGTTKIFIKGNKFLIKNLRQSLIIAFIVIAFVMALLFRNWKMILLSVIPNLIPLLITGAIMGYMGIPLKPSTALIFTIAFGIAVDDSIHYLAKYRQELLLTDFKVKIAVSNAIRETGASMIYTSIILFFGFSVFITSDFIGTIMLGVLTSTTLAIAMFTNLILLPSLLLTFDKGVRNPDSHPLIEQLDEEIYESDKDEIDFKRLEVQDKNLGTEGEEV